MTLNSFEESYLFEQFANVSHSIGEFMIEILDMWLALFKCIGTYIMIYMPKRRHFYVLIPLHA